MSKNLQGKIYYSISEVAEMVGEEPYVLRFWEKEFPKLKPKKNRAGNRTYQAKDIERVMRIKRLLHEDGYTIEGARNLLKQKSAEAGVDPKTGKVRALLGEIRAEIEDILKLFP
ncbi:MAG: MerR family transcriptional regulator [candidate division Zixibacteria bacterium]